MPIYYQPKSEFHIYKKTDVEPYLNATHRRRLQAIISLAFLTGARLIEMRRMVAEDIEFDADQDLMKVRLWTAKRRGLYIRELSFSISTDPFVVDYILPYANSMKSWNDPKKPLFPGTGRAYEIALQNLNKKLHGSDTSKYIVFHQFRHSAITYILKTLRSSLPEAMSFTGHSRVDSLSPYIIHQAPERFKGQMNR